MWTWSSDRSQRRWFLAPRESGDTPSTGRRVVRPQGPPRRRASSRMRSGSVWRNRPAWRANHRATAGSFPPGRSRNVRSSPAGRPWRVRHASSAPHQGALPQAGDRSACPRTRGAGPRLLRGWGAIRRGQGRGGRSARGRTVRPAARPATTPTLGSWPGRPRGRCRAERVCDSFRPDDSRRSDSRHAVGDGMVPCAIW